MSIQSSINAALGTMEMAQLRMHTMRENAIKEDEKERKAIAKEAEALKKKNEKTAAKMAKNQAQPAAEAATAEPAAEQQPQTMAEMENPVADIITDGNMTAGAIASGRVQAKQMQIQKAKTTSADRLRELQQRKAAARKDIRKVKSEERQIRRQLEKEGGGE